jgi:hypothetical protein
MAADRARHWHDWMLIGQGGMGDRPVRQAERS